MVMGTFDRLRKQAKGRGKTNEITPSNTSQPNVQEPTNNQNNRYLDQSGISVLEDMLRFKDRTRNQSDNPSKIEAAISPEKYINHQWLKPEENGGLQQFLFQNIKVGHNSYPALDDETIQRFYELSHTELDKLNFKGQGTKISGKTTNIRFLMDALTEYYKSHDIIFERASEDDYDLDRNGIKNMYYILCSIINDEKFEIKNSNGLIRYKYNKDLKYMADAISIDVVKEMIKGYENEADAMINLEKYEKKTVSKETREKADKLREKGKTIEAKLEAMTLKYEQEYSQIFEQRKRSKKINEFLENAKSALKPLVVPTILAAALTAVLVNSTDIVDYIRNSISEIQKPTTIEVQVTPKPTNVEVKTEVPRPTNVMYPTTAVTKTPTPTIAPTKIITPTVTPKPTIIPNKFSPEAEHIGQIKTYETATIKLEKNRDTEKIKNTISDLDSTLKRIETEKATSPSQTHSYERVETQFNEFKQRLQTVLDSNKNELETKVSTYKTEIDGALEILKETYDKDVWTSALKDLGERKKNLTNEITKNAGENIDTLTTKVTNSYGKLVDGYMSFIKTPAYQFPEIERDVANYQNDINDTIANSPTNSNDWNNALKQFGNEKEKLIERLTPETKIDNHKENAEKRIEGVKDLYKGLVKKYMDFVKNKTNLNNNNNK